MIIFQTKKINRMDNEKVLIFILVCFVVYFFFRDRWFYKQINSLRRQVRYLTKESRQGNFYVLLKIIDKDKIIETIDALKRISDCKTEEAREIADNVLSGGESIIEDSINIEWAKEIKNALDHCNAVSLIIEKKL